MDLAKASALATPATLAATTCCGVGGEVVDGGEMKEVVDLALELALSLAATPRSGFEMSPSITSPASPPSPQNALESATSSGVGW